MKFKKEDMTTRAQVALTLMLYNIRPYSHTSTIPVESSYLLYYLVDGMKDNQEDGNVVPGSRIGFEEWMWIDVTHSWDQNASNGRAISYVQESLYHLELQKGRPQEGTFQLMNLEVFQSHITWPEDRPIFPEGTHSTAVEAKQGEVEESSEEEQGEGEENNDDETGSSENIGDGDEDVGDQSDNR
ncbi:hypothetical protein KIW84_043159 [Lathyrus oleraceus]|uniref:Uncharacterized protein n=1 Tax=Pisum sativum TaxID=3888 RepID=A0A9D5AUB2_PEA|nr:hypothetical protein KIW84_043159 [Pisum sativum]